MQKNTHKKNIWSKELEFGPHSGSYLLACRRVLKLTILKVSIDNEALTQFSSFRSRIKLVSYELEWIIWLKNFQPLFVELCLIDFLMWLGWMKKSPAYNKLCSVYRVCTLIWSQMLDKKRARLKKSRPGKRYDHMTKVA